MGVLLFVVPSITAHIYFLTKLALLTSFTSTPTLSIKSTRGELSSHKVPLPKADQAHTASLFSEHQQRCVWCVHAHGLKTAISGCTRSGNSCMVYTYWKHCMVYTDTGSEGSSRGCGWRLHAMVCGVQIWQSGNVSLPTLSPPPPVVADRQTAAMIRLLPCPSLHFWIFVTSRNHQRKYFCFNVTCGKRPSCDDKSVPSLHPPAGCTIRSLDPVLQSHTAKSCWLTEHPVTVRSSCYKIAWNVLQLWVSTRCFYSFSNYWCTWMI